MSGFRTNARLSLNEVLSTIILPDETEHRGGFSDAAGRQVAPLAGRQMGGPVAHPAEGAVGQQAVRARWTVAWGSPRMSASSVESTSGV